LTLICAAIHVVIAGIEIRWFGAFAIIQYLAVIFQGSCIVVPLTKAPKAKKQKEKVKDEPDVIVEKKPRKRKQIDDLEIITELDEVKKPRKRK
jgi:hypothetical protein